MDNLALVHVCIAISQKQTNKQTQNTHIQKKEKSLDRKHRIHHQVLRFVFYSLQNQMNP